MKKCKYCMTEIDKKAKICPNCHKKQKSSKLAIIIGVIILIIGIASVSGGGNKSEEEKFSYNVEKSYLDDAGFAYYIEGTVTNKLDKKYSYLQIEFICYDKENNNIGTAIDNTNNLLGNQTWKFKAMGMFTNQEVDHCDYHEITGW